jgi:hypothetical protein
MTESKSKFNLTLCACGHSKDVHENSRCYLCICIEYRPETKRVDIKDVLDQATQENREVEAMLAEAKARNSAHVTEKNNIQPQEKSKRQGALSRIFMLSAIASFLIGLFILFGIKSIFYAWISISFLWYSRFAKSSIIDRPLILSSVVMRTLFNLIVVTWIGSTIYFLFSQNGMVVGASMLGIFMARFSNPMTRILERIAIIPLAYASGIFKNKL